MTRKLLISLAMSGGLLISGCVGDLANAIAGTNGASLSATPSSVQLFATSAQNESSATLTVQNNSPIDGAATNITPTFPVGVPFIVSNNGCSSLNQNATCQITIQGSGESSSYAPLVITYNSGNTKQTTTVNVSYSPYGGSLTGKYIFVTSQRYNGNLGGFSGADAKCTSVAANGNVTKNITSGWKAMLNGNNATTAGVEYKNTKNISLGTATGGNFVEPEYIPQNVFFSEDGYDAGISIWTGATPTSPPLVADYNCFGWTYDGSNDPVTPSHPTLGRVDYEVAGTDIWWFEGAAGGQALSYCSWAEPIYCVQQ